MTRGATGVLCSDEAIGERAREVVEQGGTATDACLAAFLFASALRPEPLLGAVRLLVVGPGVGTHVYDGSILQPGKGVQRPRGFVEGKDEIPDAARIGVSTALSALSAAYAFDGRLALGELFNPAVREARKLGAKARADLLRRVGREGPLAFRAPSFQQAMLDLAGRSEGGNLTSEDLETAGGRSLRPEEREGLVSVGVEPSAKVLQPPKVLRHVLLVLDHRGVWAGLSIQAEPDGPELPGFEVTLSRWAVPVMRGVPRLQPGTPVQVPSALAVLTEHGTPWGAVAVERPPAKAKWNDWPASLPKDAQQFETALREAGTRCFGEKSSLWAIVRLGGVSSRMVRAFTPPGL